MSKTFWKRKLQQLQGPTLYCAQHSVSYDGVWQQHLALVLRDCQCQSLYDPPPPKKVVDPAQENVKSSEI
eukprot:4629460-Amphidinium_carterae.1